MSELEMVDGHVQCPRCKHAIYAYSEVYICGSCGANGDSLDGVDVPPVVGELEASLALISDAMYRGAERWRASHPNSNIVIPDLANLIEWLLEQTHIRDGKITTLEAEVSAARTALSNVSGALVDSGVIVPAEEWRYGEAVRKTVAQRDEARSACSSLQADLIVVRGQRDKLQRDFDYQCKEFDEADAKRIAELKAAVAERDEARAWGKDERDDYADRRKYYVKARVYGAMACRYRETLEKIAGAERHTMSMPEAALHAREAIQWRHSNNGGVPWSGLDAIADLLKAQESRDTARAQLAALSRCARVLVAYVKSPAYQDHGFSWNGQEHNSPGMRIWEDFVAALDSAGGEPPRTEGR